MQYVRFPMSTLRITQGYGVEVDGISTSVSGGTYSHTGAYALDLGGADTGADYLYAPCDVEVVRHYAGSGYNAVWYKTLEPVMCADGQIRELIFMLLHANDSTISELGITVGKQFAQGKPFYKEGTGGGVDTHVHLEVGLAPFTGTGWFKSDYIDDRGQNVWIINNKLIPSDIFYLTNETNVVKDMGYNWRYLSEYVEYTNPTGVRVLAATGKNVEYFNTASADDIAGSHLPEGSEYVALGYTTQPDAYGLTYVKFIHTNGSEYWMALLSDRVELFERQTYASYTMPMILKVLKDSGKTVEYFNTPDVNDITGVLAPGSEYQALGYTTELDDNGFIYIKFAKGGAEYYTADIAGRIEVVEGTLFSEEGIDVSDHQGVIDWTQVAADGKEFAILKAVGSNTNGIYISNYWEDNYRGCKHNGIKVGAYLYTYAFNEAEAEEELTYLLRALKGKQFEYPIFVDVEDNLLVQNCTVEQITNVVKYLCTRLKQEGYYPAVYTYAYFANTYLNMADLADYDLWMADYQPPVDYMGDYQIWQYSSTGSVGGISGNVDLNISYKNYKTIIEDERLNGFMAIENAKTLNVRIRNKYDSYENWAASSLVLEAGELAIAYTTVNVDVGNGKIEQHPELLMKVGNGSATFANLPWVSAKAADVAAWAKAAKKPTYEAGEITGIDAYIADYVSTEMGIEVDTDTQYTVTKVNDYQYKLMSKSKADASFATEVATIDIPNDTAAITALEKLVGDTAVATQIANAITELDLANTYDAKGAAAAAETAAKGHADSLNTAMNTRVEALEAIDHSHANADVLDGITAEKVAAWDAAEGNAKEHATGLNTAMDTRVAALEAKFGEGEGNVESQIAAAVNAEKERAMGVEGGLADRLATVEGDYLKAADKTALQEQITANDGEIAALQELVGDKKVSEAIAAEATLRENADKALDERVKAIEDDYLTSADKTELTEAIATAKQEAIATVLGEGVDEDFDTLKEVADWILSDTTGAAALQTDVAAIKADYLKSTDKTELEGKITTAQNAADKAQGEVDALEEVVATKAAQADLEALSGRVTTVEDELNTETTGLKARMTAAEADITTLEGLVGGEKVSTQIETAITNANLGQYALASDLTALTGRVTTAEGDIDALEGRMDTAEGDIEALETEVAKKANDAALAAIAKTGSTDDLVQGTQVLVFDCGTSAI